MSVPFKWSELTTNEPKKTKVCGPFELFDAKFHDQVVSVKELTTFENTAPDPNSLQRLKREARILTELKHPNIIKLIGACFEEKKTGTCGDENSWYFEGMLVTSLGHDDVEEINILDCSQHCSRVGFHSF
eukprot:TRINITY_DN2306_c0_g1_i3.p2 TRINITY_DN2306_c0_g1~~TRINITY_DN2306_c0_g1_i3.p2  ORF type:complete len:146 (+),score=41.83 TRINITY_DN2306_c0_g1_i3:51-440(+)